MIARINAELLGNEVISEIAQGHGKSSAQVILRWNLQKGVVVIPGSSNPDYIRENTELFDFELTEEEMDRIGVLGLRRWGRHGMKRRERRNKLWRHGMQSRKWKNRKKRSRTQC